MRLVLMVLILSWVGSLSGSFQSNAGGLSVEEAYRKIPHARTVFESQEPQMDEASRTYLSKAFALIDQAIVCRVDIQFLGRTEVDLCYQPLFASLKELSPPSTLKEFHAQVADAIEQQKSALKMRNQTAGSQLPQAEVQQSSQKLHQAYGELMRLFPSVSAKNKQAFFDYLCALDFI